MYDLNSCGRPDIPFQLKKESLLNKINYLIENNQRKLDNLKSSSIYDKNEQIYFIEEQTSSFKEILKLPIETEEDYNFVQWIFNDGILRNSSELGTKIKELKVEKEKKKEEKIRNSDKYKITYHPFLFFILSFFFNIIFWGAVIETRLLAGCIMFIVISGYLAGIPLFLPPCIFTWIYVHIHDELYDITPNSDINYVIGASIAGCVTTYIKSKSIKKENVREV